MIHQVLIKRHTVFELIMLSRFQLYQLIQQQEQQEQQGQDDPNHLLPFIKISQLILLQFIRIILFVFLIASVSLAYRTHDYTPDFTTTSAVHLQVTSLSSRIDILSSTQGIATCTESFGPSPD